jgi:phosphomannomutase
MLDPKIFKAYDVRGLYPTQLDEAGAYAIGRAYVEQFEPADRGRARHAPLVAVDGRRR